MSNVILLTLDATRKDALGLFGNQRRLTPAFDSLRAKSLAFSRAQTTGPYTQASFPGLLTSSHYLDHGQPKGLHPQRVLVSEPLKRAGVVTAAFHSNPYLCAHVGWNRGWDVFYDSMNDEVEPRIPYIRGHIVNRKAINWLSSHCRRNAGKPFFLWLHYMDAHEPYVPEKKYLEMVDPSLDLSPDDMFALFKEVLLKRRVDDPAQVGVLKTLYDAHIREIDTYFAELLAALGNLGVLEETTLFITNDHGDEFGEHGGLSHDDKLYGELIDAPLLIYNGSENGVCEKVVSNLDIAPTILATFGLPPEPAFQGRPLLPTADYVETGVYGEAIDQKSKKGGDLARDSYFFRSGDLKITYRAWEERWELFDLGVDPQEHHNIVEAHESADELKAVLLQRVRRWERSSN